ncbi:transmembrane 220 family protein [Algoriphagus sediminis]|uniref:Transmembrane 220 family protein n=1 Tax=Algoriphagus sediminis TaxID=3057113 RepID=A0ABT7Y8W1_9BACT|nr:transmembrane 220 family protein [Algoriphagus sediminis]MDN3202939.1 transmembrane 220 family protein [Algoriphagus sediminis]
MKSKNFLSYYFGLWILLFGLFAYWQFNDPDPEIWVSLYGVAMIFCYLGIRKVYPKIPLTILTIVCLIGAVYFYPGEIGSWISQEVEQKDLTMKTPQMEEARETFGLLIIALVLSPALWNAWKNKK